PPYSLSLPDALPILNAVTADGVRDDAIRDGLTPAVADNRFQAAFDAQRKPSKNKWLDHLNMRVAGGAGAWDVRRVGMHDGLHIQDRKSTRLNSSHVA